MQVAIQLKTSVLVAWRQRVSFRPLPEADVNHMQQHTKRCMTKCAFVGWRHHQQAEKAALGIQVRCQRHFLKAVLRSWKGFVQCKHRERSVVATAVAKTQARMMASVFCALVIATREQVQVQVQVGNLCSSTCMHLGEQDLMCQHQTQSE